MTLTIGRVGLDPATLTAPRTGGLGWGARELQVAGHIDEATVAAARAVRDQILGLGRNVDEIVVPVTWDTDSGLDGWWRVVGVSVDSIEASYVSDVFPFSVDLRRVGSAAEVDWQATLIGATLRNDHALGDSDAQPWHALPVGADSYDRDGTTVTEVTRSSVDGSVSVYTGVADGTFPRWHHTPAQHYDGAVTVRVGGDVKVGLWTPDSPGDFQLDNGLVRVTEGTSSPDLSIDAYDGSSWETKEWRWTIGGSVLSNAWEHIAIVSNGPEAATLRLTNTEGGERVTLDLTLRRGSRYVETFLTVGSSSTLGVERVSAEAGTTVTGGLRATSNDADGNRYVVASMQDHTADTTQGGLSVASATRLDAIIGAEVGGSSAQSGDAADDLIAQRLGGITVAERTRRR